MSEENRKLLIRQFKKQREFAHEETATQAILSAFSVPVARRSELQEIAAANGRSRAVLADFREYFEDSPICFAVARPSSLKNGERLSHWFPLGNAKSQELLKLYDQMREELEYEADGRPIVALLPWPRVSEILVMHQLHYNAELPGVRVLYNEPRKVGNAVQRRITLEPISQFVALLHTLGVTTLG